MERKSNETVQHDYHDHAEKSEADLIAKDNYKIFASSGVGQGELSFPVRLHYMLSDLEKDGKDDIISWQPHGRCFLVHKQKEFVEELLPKYFRQSLYASFQRQLNIYGFKRITTGRDKNGYYHEYFLRGKQFLANRIQRIKKKGEGGRKPAAPESEPNFYSMPFLPTTKPTKLEFEASKSASTGILFPISSGLQAPVNGTFLSTSVPAGSLMNILYGSVPQTGQQVVPTRVPVEQQVSDMFALRVMLSQFEEQQREQQRASLSSRLGDLGRVLQASRTTANQNVPELEPFLLAALFSKK